MRGQIIDCNVINYRSGSPPASQKSSSPWSTHTCAKQRLPKASKSGPSASSLTRTGAVVIAASAASSVVAFGVFYCIRRRRNGGLMSDGQ